MLTKIISMSFLSLVVKNPFRNKTRSFLAIIGISIGIMVIVALGMVTGGLKSSTESTLKAGAAEITVIQPGSSNGNGEINEAHIADIKNINGVKDAVGLLRTINTSSTGTSGISSALSDINGGFSVIGIESDKLNLIGIDSVDGNVFSNNSENEVIIGKIAAQNLNKNIGDNINLYGQEFKITGIFETGNYMTDGGAFMSLNTLQNLTNNNNKVTSISVKIKEDTNITELRNVIDNNYPNELSALSSSSQENRMNTALNTIDTANWLFSIIAVIIGGLGIINTMVMSVNERTREIGVLKAVGWKESRILAMVLGESLVLTTIAAIVGIIIAIIGMNVLISATSIGGIIKPYFSMDILIRALAVAFIVGVLGGLYPAYHASRLSPMEALRYE